MCPQTDLRAKIEELKAKLNEQLKKQSQSASDDRFAKESKENKKQKMRQTVRYSHSEKK
ncbi:Hypothetical predicted protein [Scomber scombrus]|uniref:Uncharacterized protein n=1 Tax=Scomber scombrus TaxID=13677 RepID=A0AAV1PUA5_SCOSC